MAEGRAALLIHQVRILSSSHTPVRRWFVRALGVTAGCHLLGRGGNYSMSWIPEKRTMRPEGRTSHAGVSEADPGHVA